MVSGRALGFFLSSGDLANYASSDIRRKQMAQMGKMVRIVKIQIVKMQMVKIQMLQIQMVTIQMV